MVIKKLIELLLLFGGVIQGTVSCVDDVDFSTSYDKKVVVECVLNNLTDTQSLKMYYNSDGVATFDPLPEDVSAELYQNGTLIGRFVRHDSYNWHLPLSLSLNVEDSYGSSNIRKLSWENMQYELIVKVDGKTISSNTNLKSGTVVSSHLNGGVALSQQFSGNSGLWLCNLNAEEDIYKCWPNQIDERYRSIYFLYLERNSYFDSFNRIADATYYLCAKAIGAGAASFGNDRMLIASDEYDQYLKSYITKKMEEDSDNPAKQMNEYKLYTNINGGTGIFALYFVYNHLPPSNISY